MRLLWRPCCGGVPGDCPVRSCLGPALSVFGVKKFIQSLETKSYNVFSYYLQTKFQNVENQICMIEQFLIVFLCYYEICFITNISTSITEIVIIINIFNVSN